MLKIPCCKAKAILLCIFFVESLSFAQWGAYASTKEDASVAINEADNSLKAAFRGIQEAEMTGADVSSLVPRLNAALDALGLATYLYGSEDFGGAIINANASMVIAQRVEADAATLRDQTSSPYLNWWQTILFSSVGSAAFLAIVALFWMRFKHRYIRRIGSLRPAKAE
jgi:hypothetical protein